MKKRKGVAYAIAFNTKEIPGRAVSTVVTLTTEVAGPEDKYRVDLCDHPLYPQLVDYVNANPPGGKAKG
ncbi:MAG: hypothetical protein IPK75_01420 [Acidobacteria bacterium]|nr:hypothetical protein [Acidobacteriota bacterium]